MSSIIRNNNIEKHPCSIADIENEIKIAEEKQERSTVIKLKRQLKKMLIMNIQIILEKCLRKID